NVTLLNNKINYSLLKTYTNKIINLPLKYLQLKKPGDFINRINDLHTIKDFFTKTLIEIIINIIFFISTLIILFVLNTNLTVILFILSIIYITVVSLMNKKLYKQITTLIDAENIFTDRVVEYLNKITTIKTLKSSYFINNLDSDIKKSLNLKLDFDYKLSKIDLVKNSFEELMLILILLLHFNITKNITSAIIFISIYGYFLESIKFASDIMPSLLYLKEIYYRISSVYDLDLKKKTKKIGKDIEIKNLSFSYNKLDNVLDNLNLNINEGEKVLLEGANGSGKSTLLNIISGLYDYDHGNVKVPSKVSYIDQKSELFRGSIIDNIILDKRFDKEKFKRLEKILYLKEIIKNKSLGYNTNLESISNLSGGERQKIIMARTLYQDFNLLIMDESLSLISKDIRSKILKNINKYYRDKTIIYVSHYDDNFSFNKKINLTAREEKYVNR
ncbi:MAG TPA: ABC transporter ATP-binding protein, partial [Mollicutes bacterium]|nr:ABC transporter ATP-binding protein [Mollicutes bacterium]